MDPRIHLRGLVCCALGFGLAFVLFTTQAAMGNTRIYIGGAPLAVGMIGLIEMISGYPFYKMAQKWDAMPGLVRFGLGLVIIAVFVVGFWCAGMFYLRG
jgi:hypothetical protein